MNQTSPKSKCMISFNYRMGKQNSYFMATAWGYNSNAESLFVLICGLCGLRWPCGHGAGLPSGGSGVLFLLLIHSTFHCVK